MAERGYAVRYCSAEPAEEERTPEGGAVTWVGARGEKMMPDLRSMPFRTALRALEGLPVTISVEGSGRILGQDPPPGTAISAGQAIRLAGLPDGRIGSAGKEKGKK
jgi:beta-lactam-binding protein with PASTA domain